MGTVRRSRHNVYQIHYHFVTPVKYRRVIFGEPDREQALRIISKGIEERYEVMIEAVGIDQDHVHWLVSAAPKYSPTELIRMIKSISAREMFRMFPEIREQLWGGELWTDAFYVGTVGEGGNKKVIERYVSRQGEVARRERGQLKLFDPLP